MKKKFGARVSAAAATSLALAGVLAGPAAAQSGPIDIPELHAIGGPGAQGDVVQPMWLNGKSTRYPAAGGKWVFGFWNTQIRSYYTVGKCHGSTVQLNNDPPVRSINTAAGRTSYADTFALNYWGNNDQYWYRLC